MKTIKKIVIDTIPVILGVLIALFVENGKESYDNKRFLNRVMAAIDNEMEGNQQDVKKVLDRQKVLLDSLFFYLDNEQEPIEEILYKVEGFQVPNIHNNSWKAFLSTKLELLDIQLLSILSNVEDASESLMLKTDKLLDFASTRKVKSASREDKELFTSLVMNIMNSEERLLELFDTYTEHRSK